MTDCKETVGVLWLIENRGHTEDYYILMVISANIDVRSKATSSKLQKLFSPKIFFSLIYLPLPDFCLFCQC